jgi:MDMPI C-terminal domain./Mycothiol maleylpyruvate isomerase N-terminal domain.
VPDASRPTATSSDSSGGGPRTPGWWRGSRTATEPSWRRSRRLRRSGTWTFLEAPTPLAFWARRQAHETAIHRVDAERAGGDVTGFPSGFAVDGIDELLLRFANRTGRPLPTVETTRSMVVRAKDEPRSWRVTFASSGFQIEADPIDDDAELLVTGDASELYVLLWNRRDAAGSEMDGETDLLDLWRETVQIRWS